MRKETILVRARFDAKLPIYWMLSTLIGLTFTVVGIPLVPVWLLVGRRIHRRQYEALECELTERSLHVRRGFLFRVEKHIPLDKIQDVALKEGPILRRLGLATLSVETAGQTAAQGGDATLVGVVDAPDFRDAILEQRDRVVAAASSSSDPRPAATPESALVAIRDSLLRIEALLQRRESR
jgi:putative membrane protein